MNSDKFIQLLNLFRKFQLKNKAILYFGTKQKITLAEFHLLLEIETCPGISSKKLSQLTLLSKQVVSMLIKKMENKKIIRITKDPSDARSYRLFLTSNGEKGLRSTDIVADRKLEELTKLLSANEIKDFNYFIKLIADGYNVPTSGQIREEHELRLQIRRITRAFGLLGGNVLGSDSTSLVWHMLSELREDSATINSTKLAALLDVPVNSIISATKELTKNKLITSYSDIIDKRSSILVLTQDGINYLNGIYFNASKALKNSMKDFTADQIQKLIITLEKIIGTREAADSIQIRKLKSQGELNQVRWIALEYYNKLSVRPNLSGNLFAEQNIIYGGFQKNKLIYGIELIKKNEDSYIVLNLVSSLDSMNPSLVNKFKQQVVEKTKNSKKNVNFSYHKTAFIFE